jgi:hypothetical protein
MDGYWSIGVSLTSAGAPTAMQYQRIDPYGVAPRNLLLTDLSQDGRTDVVMTDDTAGLLVARHS